MPFPCQVWLRQTAYDYLDSLHIAGRQRLLVWIERLAAHPSRSGDFTERGADGRAWQVAVVAAHAVVWWVDRQARLRNTKARHAARTAGS